MRSALPPRTTVCLFHCREMQESLIFFPKSNIYFVNKVVKQRKYGLSDVSGVLRERLDEYDRARLYLL